MALRAGRVGVHPSQVDSNGKVKAGLNPEQQAKLDRALLTPISAPVETELVAITTGREQKNLGIGEGLAIENNKLKVTSSGGITCVEKPLENRSISSNNSVDGDIPVVEGKVPISCVWYGLNNVLCYVMMYYLPDFNSYRYSLVNRGSLAYNIGNDNKLLIYYADISI